MKLSTITLVIAVILVAGCVTDNSKTSTLNENTPPPLPDASDISTASDNDMPPLPNANSEEPDSPSGNSPPIR